VIGGSDVTLEFGEDDFAGGSGGCNSYGTQYQVTNGSVSFGEIESTLIACLEEGVMEQESAYFNALHTVGEFEMMEDELLIRYNDGGSVLIFERTGPY
jgi:putative lipoprotein